LETARECGFEGIELEHNFPQIRRAVREVANYLRCLKANVVCCSGYKPDLIGLLASRQANVPAVSVSHGWTGATWKVRCYETLDRMALRWMDAVVCVSEGQAAKVRRTSAPQERIHVIHNATELDGIGRSAGKFRQEMEAMFPTPPRYIVGAAGRLSPEKGFDKLVEAAALAVKNNSQVGFVVFGEGPRRSLLERLIVDKKLTDHFVFAGFRSNLQAYLPHFDLLALPSYTEGLPVIVLEAMAAGLAVVATAVGGVPEAVEHLESGLLVQAGNAEALAKSIAELLGDHSRRHAMGKRGQMRVRDQFSFAGQSLKYQQLFAQLLGQPKPKRRLRGSVPCAAC
jgi:glycosyltransferase involved in cell wall biosynthesis